MPEFTKATCKFIGGLFTCLLLQACAGTPQTDALLDRIPPQFVEPVELSDVPFFPQEAYQCGPAALATVMVYQGIRISPEQLTPKIYIPQKQGSLQVEIVRTIRDYNLVPYVIEPALTNLLSEIKAGHPVLVMQNLGVSWYPQWHYAVVIGYNLQDEVVLLRTGDIERYPMKLYTFEYTWERSKHWAVVALPANELPATADRWQYLRTIVAFEQTQNWPVLNQAYESGLKRWPGDRDLLMGYGTALYLQKRLQEAQQYYELILSREDYAPAYNNTAQIYAEQGDFDRALQYVQKAIDLGGVHGAQYRATLDEIKQMQKNKKSFR